MGPFDLITSDSPMKIFQGWRSLRLLFANLAVPLAVFVGLPAQAASFTSVLSTSQPHQAGTATLLPDGKVLLTGGGTGSGGSAVMEFYDPALGSWSSSGSLTLTTNRAHHTATLLQNGKVL